VTTWLERLKEERRELVLKIEALARYKLSDEFRTLPKDTQKLMMDQHRHMNAYADCLYYRLRANDTNPA
jgi:hypothetical protein